MNIGLVTYPMDYNRTGTGNYVFNLVKELIQDNENNYTLIHFEKSNIELYRQTNEIIIPKSVIPKTFFISSYLSINSIIKREKFDIIHSLTNVGLLFPGHFNKINTVFDLSPYLFPETHTFWQSHANRYFYRFSYWNKDKIIAISNSTKIDLMRYFHIPEHKIKVIYLGIDSFYKPADTEEQTRVLNKYCIKQPFILFVGTLEPRKNIPTLLKSFYKLKKNKYPHKLVIVGRKGWRYRNIFEIISSLKLQDEIIFTGYVPEEDLPGLYSAANLFVYPSLYEGFGLPPLEAMACGCPVITSNTSSLPEIIGDGGVLVNPYDFEAFTKVIQNLIDDLSLKEELIKKGFSRSRFFSWKQCAKSTYEVYKDVYIGVTQTEN